MIEFTQKVKCQDIQLEPPDFTKTSGEIADLIRLARLERSDALNEIFSQKDEFLSHFMALLGASPHSHPNTHRVLYAASHIGMFMSMYYKGQYSRARPGQLCPALLPPTQAPGHSSYPSGHATQAHLMALCVTEALPGEIRIMMAGNLKRLAHRIARNREIAGLHYESDSQAGETLAKNTFNALQRSQLVRLSRAVEAAQKEWRQDDASSVTDKP
jgi:hypothetical protein